MQKNWLLRLVAAAALMAVVFGCASRQRVSEEDSHYYETVSVSGVSKDALYGKVYAWAQKYFQGPNDISLPISLPEKSRILSADKNTGSIAANNTIATTMTVAANIDYPDGSGQAPVLVHSGIAITVGDGQYRLQCGTSNRWQLFCPKIVVMGKTQSPDMFTRNQTELDERILGETQSSWSRLADSLRAAVSGKKID